MKKTIISISLALLAIALTPVASAQSHYKKAVINGKSAYVVVPKSYYPKSYHYRTVRTGVCRTSGRGIYKYVRSYPIGGTYNRSKYTKNHYTTASHYKTYGKKVVRSKPVVSIRF